MISLPLAVLVIVVLISSGALTISYLFPRSKS